MRAPIEVTEYDTLTYNKDFKNSEKYRFLNEKSFKQLVDFIRTFDNPDGDDVHDLMRLAHKKNVGDTVTFKNYVGVIELPDGQQIEILPKVEFQAGGKDQTKRIFLNMLRALKDFPVKVFSTANLGVERMSIYDILINIYLQQVRYLLRKGLRSAYIRNDENLTRFKGKLLVNQQLKYNYSNRQKFFVSFDEFKLDRPENKLIKATLLKLQRVTGSNQNSKLCRQLLRSFDQVNPSNNYELDFSRVQLDRTTIDYEMLIAWAKIFLYGKSFTTFSGEQASRSLLFSMEKLFEGYVAKYVVERASREKQWQVSTQDRGYYLFNRLDNEEAKRFALRPDLVLRSETQETVILDTKWKRLINDPRKNFGISQADMYQMYAYAKKYNTSQIWLLYPVSDQIEEERILTFTSDDQVSVSVFFINLARIEDSIDQLLTLISERVTLKSSAGNRVS
ncbi:McrC family protein [uncultured Varibaculum sp.]|uniref:McrC family protein n=1 Tax=uncultured Varibaculum sp. TaxID=413896 RepID=UPI0027D9B47F|nr:McrC family protein [uncultured Varibaculum sp.]